MIKLVPILNRVMKDRFAPTLKFHFKWMSRFPIMIVTRKQMYNFAYDICDHTVYQTHLEYKAKLVGVRELNHE